MVLTGCGLIADKSAAGLDAAAADVSRAVSRGDMRASLKDRYCTPGSSGVSIAPPDAVRWIFAGSGFVSCAAAVLPAAKLVGPVYVVNLVDGRADASLKELPSALRAPTLAQAPVLAYVRCSRRAVGDYAFFHKAYAQDCDVVLTVRHGTGQSVVDLWSYTKSPPNSIDFRFVLGDVVAEKPDGDIAQYLTQMVQAPVG